MKREIVVTGINTHIIEEEGAEYFSFAELSGKITNDCDGCLSRRNHVITESIIYQTIQERIKI